MAPTRDRAYQTFLGKLVQARHEAQLTQSQVAARLRKPQSYVSKCETGERRVDVVELKDFAEIYRRSLEWFVN